MQTTINITFEQLLDAVMQLPKAEFLKLKSKMNEKKLDTAEKDEFLKILENGPVATEDDLKRLEEVDKYMKSWKVS